ncbi:MAG: two component transcriptional regulator LuxR family [Stygiobacter sp.]|nr:MAG: two component transcriptional regulator LuxR family [Stygiobacter sp.]KAF0215438.1 MAG: two component transcriptional regulator LuxR [Ignavibacteria bacterium]
MNIAITDDHEIIREGLKKILAKHDDLKVVAEASSIAELEKLLDDTQIDFIMLDISLPDKSGLDFVKDIKSRFPEVKVLIFSIYPEEKFAKRAINLGADGYLSKNAKPSEIIEAIRKIERGGKYLKAELIEELFLHNDKLHTNPTHELLSNREFEVLRLLAKGNKITEIAESLGLSVNTIASYKTRIQDKLNIKSTAELIRYAIDNDLVEKY